MTLTFHSSGDVKSGKEERHGSFGAMILWNYVRRLVLKTAESEGIDTPVGPMMIIVFSEAVPTVVLWGMLEASAKNVPE